MASKIAARLKKASTVKAAKPAPVEEEEVLLDEELEDLEEELESLDEELEDLEEELDEDLEEDDLDEEDEDLEEEEEETPPKKAAASKPVKKAAPKATKPAAKKAASQPPKKALFTQRVSKEATPLVEGGLMTRDHLIGLYAEKMSCTKADAERAIKGLEEVVKEEVFPLYSINLFGTHFKRSIVPARVYQGNGGLTNIPDNGLATEVNEHVVIRANIHIGVEKRRGKVDKKGNFIPLKK